MRHPAHGFVIGATVLAAATLSASSTSAQRRMAQPSQPNPAAAASTAQRPLANQELGRRFSIKPDDLPDPLTGPIVHNPSLLLPFKDQKPLVPEGFTVNAFATGLENPRRLLVLPNGDVIVAEQKPGHLTLLRDENGDGRADWIERHADGFNGPYGLAWRDDHILVADQDGIWRVPHSLGAVRGTIVQPKPISEVDPAERRPLPNTFDQRMITKKGVFGLVQGHTNHHLAIDPGTGALFVSVGSSGNLGIEPAVKATIQQFGPDGSNQATFASGMRNPTALAFQPGSGDLYAIVQERDGMGDHLVPDYLMRVQKGAFYGWPYAYIGQHPQPGFAKHAPDKVKATVTPDLLFEPHSSAMDLVFYDAGQFPAEYRGDAFVALKGSWNRSEPTGYTVVRVRFKDGRPQGWYENFATGFWVSGRNRAEVWGRPTALAIAKDGSLLIADDTGGTIWRVSYSAPREQSGTPKTTTTGAPAQR